MNSYQVTVWALAGGLLANAYGAGIAVEAFLAGEQETRWRRIWLAIASGGLLLALINGYALELALRTGLHDLRQAVLAMLAAMTLAIASHLLSRP